MSKSLSYFEWSRSFRTRSPKENPDSEKESPRVNSIGIPEEDFKDFLKEWKKKNF